MPAEPARAARGGARGRHARRERGHAGAPRVGLLPGLLTRGCPPCDR